MLQRIPDDLDFVKESRFLKTKNAFFAEYQQKSPGKPREVFISKHTLIFVLKGAKIFRLNNEILEVPAGEVIFLKRGCYIICEGVEREEQYESISLFFNENLLSDFWNSHYYLLTQNYASSNDFNDVLVLKENTMLAHFRQTMISYFEYTGLHLEPLIKKKFEELILLLLDTEYKNKIIRYFSLIYSRSKPSVEYIVNENIFKPVTIDELAKLSMRSLSVFKKEFTDQFQVSPKKWILEQRLQKAHFLLSSTQKTVTEIGYECGFESTSHFIKVYKTRYNKTPNTFRN